MEYKGIELEEFASDRPVVFDPPKEMLVWDDTSLNVGRNTVYAYLPERSSPAQGTKYAWDHCAEIPEELKPRRATNMELAKWLAQGNGQYSEEDETYIWTYFAYVDGDDDCECSKYILIRKWDDKEWHEPTADYMGLKE